MAYDEHRILEMLHEDEISRRRAFESIVNNFSEQLYWQIRHMVLSHDDANDILQNTFIKAWTNLDSFMGYSRISTWLYRIAINESLDFVRKQKNVEMVSSDDVDTGIANQLLADDYFDGDATDAQLQEAIAQLPEVQRTVFNLRYYDEMKYSEISRITGTSEGALKASYHIAVKKISEFFHRHD